MLTFAKALEILQNTYEHASQQGMATDWPVLLMGAQEYIQTRPQDRALDEFDGNILSRLLLLGFRRENYQSKVRLQAGFRIFKLFFGLEQDEEALYIFEHLGPELLPKSGFTPKHFEALCNIAKQGSLIPLVNLFKRLDKRAFSDADILNFTKHYGKNPSALALHDQLYDSIEQFAPKEQYLKFIPGQAVVITERKTLLTRPVMETIIFSLPLDMLSDLNRLIQVFGRAEFLNEAFLDDLLKIRSLSSIQYLHRALNLAKERLFGYKDCLFMVRFVAEHPLDIPLLQTFTTHDNHAFFNFLIQENLMQVEILLTCLRYFSSSDPSFAKHIFDSLFHLFSNSCKAYADYQYLPEVIKTMQGVGFSDPDVLLQFLLRWADGQERSMLTLKKILEIPADSRACFDVSVIQRIAHQKRKAVFCYLDLLKKYGLLNSKDDVGSGLSYPSNVFDQGVNYLSQLSLTTPRLFDTLNEQDSFALIQRFFDERVQSRLQENFPSFLTILNKILRRINFENCSELSEEVMEERSNFFHLQLIQLIHQDTNWRKICSDLLRLNQADIFSTTNFCQIFARLKSPQNTHAHRAILMLHEAKLLTEEYFFAFYEFLFRNDCLKKGIEPSAEPDSKAWIKMFQQLQNEPCLHELTQDCIIRGAFKKLRRYIHDGLLTPEQLCHEINLYLDHCITSGEPEPPEALLTLYIQSCARVAEKYLLEHSLNALTIHAACQQFTHWMLPLNHFLNRHSEVVQNVIRDTFFEIATQLLDVSERLQGTSVGAYELLNCQALLLLQFASDFSSSLESAVNEDKQTKRLLEVMAQDDEDNDCTSLQQQLIAAWVIQQPWLKSADFKQLLNEDANAQERLEQLACRLMEVDAQNKTPLAPVQKAALSKVTTTYCAFFTMSQQKDLSERVVSSTSFCSR